MLIRFAVHYVDPEARVILYGSQARGEANKWSDWDVIVLCEDPLTPAYRRKILDALYEVELGTGEIISAVVIDEATWQARGKGTPFFENVVNDGIVLLPLAA